MKPRLLITGGGGFVGANLIRHFLTTYEIHMTAQPGSDAWRVQDIKDRITIHHIDLTSKEHIIALIESIKPTHVIHTAVYGAYPAVQKDTELMVRTNVLGTMYLLDACLKHPLTCFINTGSNSEYGAKSAPMCETDVLEPDTEYGVTKAAATLYCQKVARAQRAPVVTLRLFSVFGPWEENNRLFTEIFSAYRDGRAPKLASPEYVRDFTYVGDVCRAYELALTHPHKVAGEIFNVCGGTQRTIREVAQEAHNEFPDAPAPEYGEAVGRAFETATWVGDNKKIKRALGWEPQPFTQSIQATAAWYRTRHT